MVSLYFVALPFCSSVPDVLVGFCFETFGFPVSTQP